jgi:5-methylcytosine-specific restriction endonuclease McrA
MKSPNLTEEELRLALWAYLQREDASISKSGAGVHWLSAALKQLPIHPNESRPPPGQFRTREGLARRLRELEGIAKGTSDRKLKNYRFVWSEYGLDADSLGRDARRLLDRYGLKISLRPPVWKEIKRRHELWERLQAEGDPGAAGSPILRDLGIYRGQAGIYMDKPRTSEITGGEHGITVSVMHTGSDYPDDLGGKTLRYHYPSTGRPSAYDRAEIEATKNAGRLGIPIFVVIGGQGAGQRRVRVGRVTGWDDAAGRFSIVHAPGPARLYREVARRLEEETQIDMRPDWTEIPHLKRPGQSSFYGPCRTGLRRGNDLLLAVPATVEFEKEKAGYPGDELVEIQSREEETFRSDWKGSDPTRFPARIKAAATALRDEGYRGTFRVQQEEGTLVISAAGQDPGGPAPEGDGLQARQPEDSGDAGGEPPSNRRPSSRGYSEGRKQTTTTTRRERDPQARQDCIDYWGAECYICGFDFGATYGEEWSDFIHVHHETPLAEVEGEREVDPVEDLKPLCPNCHAIVHKRTPPYSPQEVRRMIGP